MDIGRLRELLATRRKDGSWAYNVNFCSKRIHEGVWSGRPSIDYVAEYVLPLMHQAQEEIGRVKPQGNFGRYIHDWANTIAKRARNLRRYVEGKPSDFISHATLKKYGLLERVN